MHGQRYRLANFNIVAPSGVALSDLIVAGEWIEALGSCTFQGKTIDGDGDYLLPGLVELHTDNLERHLEPRPGTYLPPVLAVRAHDAELAAAGITTAFDALTVGGDDVDASRATLLTRALAALAECEARTELRSEHRLHLRCEVSDGQLARKMSELSAAVPRLISVMDHTPGQGQYRDLGQFRRYYARRYGLSQEQIHQLIEKRQNVSASFGLENREVVSKFARRRHAFIASHDDETAEDVAMAKASGCCLSEFPITSLAAQQATQLGMQVIAGAPNLVRGGSSSGNVAVAQLIADKAVHILSSDYYPPSLLAAVFLLEERFGFALHEAVDMASRTPARAVALDDRGVLASGFLADMLRVRPTPSGPRVISVWRRGRRIH